MPKAGNPKSDRCLVGRPPLSTQSLGNPPTRKDPQQCSDPGHSALRRPSTSSAPPPPATFQYQRSSPSFRVQLSASLFAPSSAPPSPPVPRALHVAEQDLEAVAQGLHVHVGHLLQLEGARHDLDGPALQPGVPARLEAQAEVARVLGVEAEGVDGPPRVGLGVRGEPLLCEGG